jgi:MHS family proline/betaine transporter-like MFS transporter
MPFKRPITLRYIILATLLGNTVQWYDYHLFNFLAPILMQVFFPPENVWTHISYSSFLLISHAIARLLGAFAFGYEGDKRGRRPALVISIGLMTFSSFCIALIPSFEKIGWLAFILFSFFRCLQSFAAGGEFTGGMLYLVESAPVKKRGFYGSFSFFGLSLGIFASSCNYLIFGSDLSEMQFLKWGWRLLYLFGAVAGMVVFLLRRRFHETHLFLEAKHETHGENNPFMEMLARHKSAVIKTFGIGILEAVGFNLLIGFLVNYWHEIWQIPLKRALEMNFFAIFFFPFLIIFFGKLTSIWHIKKQAVITAFLFCCGSIPLFFLMANGGDLGKVAGLIVFLVILSGYMVSLPALYCEMFPTRVRFIGVSLGYNLAVSLFGASAPDAIIYLTRFMPPAWDLGVYLTLGALISLIALLRTKEKIISVR